MALAAPKILEQKMKQPVNWMQFVGIIVTIVIAAWTGVVTQNNRIAKLEEKVEYTKEQYQDLKAQITTLQLDIRQVLITIQNKEDRK